MARLSLIEQKFYYYYFLIHIPITVFIDASVVIPPPGPVARVVQWHIKQNNDFLLKEKPDWLYWFVVLELVLQLPLFAYFALKFRSIWQTNVDRLSKEQKANFTAMTNKLYKWLRLYGLNASFTTLVCIITILQRGYYPELPNLSLSSSDKLNLVLVYLPTFLIPLRLCFL